MRRGGGGFRGGGRMGGGFGGGRSGGGRIGGGIGGRSGSGRMGGGIGGRTGGLGGGGRAPGPRRGGMGGFGTGLGLGMGLGMMGGRRRRGWGWGGGWGRRRMMPMGGMGMGPRGGGGCGGGCMGILMAAVMLIIVLTVIAIASNFAFAIPGVGSNVQMTRSTHQREALPMDAADSTIPFLFDDHISLIDNHTVASNGLRNFHNRTGVRPILYIVGDLNGNTNPNMNDMRAFAEARYAELTGGNEAHALLLFFFNNNFQGRYFMYVTVGTRAQLVMDGEAQDILMDFVQRDWDNRGFGNAFDGASEHIMTVTRSPWIPVLIVAGILLILLLLFNWWKRKQDQKNLEAEQTERILSQPLETIGGDDAASRLAQQYEDDN